MIRVLRRVRLRTPESSAAISQPTIWRIQFGLLAAVVILLFIPWSGSHAGPTADLRPELLWSSILTIVLGALGLAINERWIAFVAALPTLGALTDIGPVFMPESGSYPFVVKLAASLVCVIGILWVVRALRYPSTAQSTRWAVAPVAVALTIATLWLPWVVVSGIGTDSGQMTAFTLLFGSSSYVSASITVARIAVLIVMVVGAGGSLLPLITRKDAGARIATVSALGSSVMLVILAAWLAVRGDQVQQATDLPGPRVALAGLVLLGLIWKSRIGNDVLPLAGDPLPEPDDAKPSISADALDGAIDSSDPDDVVAERVAALHEGEPIPASPTE